MDTKERLEQKKTFENWDLAKNKDGITVIPVMGLVFLSFFQVKTKNFLNVGFHLILFVGMVKT
ncbi:22694_t:CDS:2 [Gigaspora margarita]|uniref:22694_t:CDS:1 n=1 Tax=Gigaspora margarita TaxID=4874 RepID=A0ABN7UNL1_GIGMA|nr:22694_t:CDS:2 [Gigaspora margarita]